MLETNRMSVICGVCDWKQQKNCDSHRILSYDHAEMLTVIQDQNCIFLFDLHMTLRNKICRTDTLFIRKMGFLSFAGGCFIIYEGIVRMSSLFYVYTIWF